MYIVQSPAQLVHLRLPVYQKLLLLRGQRRCCFRKNALERQDESGLQVLLEHPGGLAQPIEVERGIHTLRHFSLTVAVTVAAAGGATGEPNDAQLPFVEITKQLGASAPHHCEKGDNEARHLAEAFLLRDSLLP